MRSHVARLAEWWWAYKRVREHYARFYGRAPRIFAPRTFSEKMQWRKLFDDYPMFKVFCDKIAVRDYLSTLGLSELLAPLLWVGDDPEKIPFDQITEPAVLKTTGAAAQSAVLTPGKIDRDALIAAARDWLSISFGKQQVEPGYLSVPPRLMIEAFIGDVARPPIELKLFVFDGTLRFLQMVEIDVGRNWSTAYFLPDWTRLYWKGPTPRLPEGLARPEVLPLAREIAERIGRGLDHVRVDFYSHADRLFVGEVTPYSWSGLMHFEPPEVDSLQGAYWHLPQPASRALRRVLRGWWSVV